MLGAGGKTRTRFYLAKVGSPFCTADGNALGTAVCAARGSPGVLLRSVAAVVTSECNKKGTL